MRLKGKLVAKRLRPFIKLIAACLSEIKINNNSLRLLSKESLPCFFASLSPSPGTHHYTRPEIRKYVEIERY